MRGVAAETQMTNMTPHVYDLIQKEIKMKECSDAIKETLEAMRLVNVPSAVEHYVGKLHMLTDNADPKVRIHVEEEIYAARKRVGSLPKTANETQVAGEHYRTPIQHWDLVVANDIPYLDARALAYIMRHANKNGKEDLLKAKHFIDKMIEVYYGGA